MGFGGALKKFGHQLSQSVNNAPKVAAQIGTIGALPITAAFSSVGAGLTAAAPVLSQANGILAQNPALAGALGDALGITGLGGAFGGQSGGGMDPGGYAAPAKPGVPIWVWIAGAGAALVALFLIVRKP